MFKNTFKLDDQHLEVFVGGFADQADGAVWLKVDNNIVMTTIVAEKSAEEFDFFPLTVEFRKRPSAAGKFPGGYLKREGRLSDREVLTSRLIDRSIRPFFSEGYNDSVQIFSTLMSSDGSYPYAVMGVISASLAAGLAGLPFDGPVASVIFSKSQGQWRKNIPYLQWKESDDHIFVSGDEKGICMVEGQCSEIEESELLSVLAMAEAEIRKIVAWQKEVIDQVGKQKEEFKLKVSDQELEVAKEIRKKIFADTSVFFGSLKKDISTNIKNRRAEIVQEIAKEMPDLTVKKLESIFDNEFKKSVSEIIISNKKRLDGRTFDQIRKIECLLDMLPACHGSAMFRRGQTNVLATVSLGTASDAQKEESLFEKTIDRTFMIHYNFPPFSTGEVKQMRSVGRREIGHGYLVEKALLPVIPAHEKFPYTTRVIADVLECFGSSSMASTCASSLALMTAGVPLSKHVAGIAMGLLQHDKKVEILSDISGMEDQLGLMDLKVTGTRDGVTAFQMDIKAKAGFGLDLFEKAFERARIGRLHILGIMEASISAPRKEVAGNAPRVVKIKIPQDKIGALIGPGGKNIKEIIAKTGVQIDVNDEGQVLVFGDGQSSETAIGMIRLSIGEIAIGGEYNGTIRGITDFGAFVDFGAAKEGLVHVSNMPREIKNNFAEKLKIGEKVRVIVKEADHKTGRIKLVFVGMGDSDKQ